MCSNSKFAREWWVTIAEDDDEASKALELCQAIKLTLTSRDIAVIIGPSVTKEMRLKMETHFDWVICQSYESPVSSNVGGLQLPAQVQLFLELWKLPINKALFVRAGSLILKNCDELWESESDWALVPSRNLGGMAKFDTSVMILKPNYWTLRSIRIHIANMEQATKDQGLTPTGILDSYLRQNNMCVSITELPPEYNFKVVTSGTPLEMSDIGTRIVTFDSGVHVKDWTLSHMNKLQHMTRLYQLPHHSENLNEDLMCEKEDIEGVAGSIAIVGLSCRFPGANNENEFWEVLSEGRDETKPLPNERYFTQTNMEDTNDAFKTPIGYLKCPIDEFDAKFFHISRREAEYMDPQQRLLLEVCWESLENAGVNPHSLDGSSAAVYVGIWAQEYSRYFKDSDIKDFELKYLGNALCASSARISHFLGIRGASVTMEAGCASALEAFHFACEDLRTRRANIAISCGCKTFDESADGFARGENCVVLILKRLADAVRDSDRVLGIIRGSALNSDGAGSALGTPNGRAQEIVLREALRVSKLHPNDISYLEAHGTGTPVGDPIEFAAINNVFSNEEGPRLKPLIVGSVKSNIGHGEGSSGMAGLVKVLLCMKHATIPRQLHLKNLNPYIDLSKIPAIIPLENTKWEPNSKQGLVAGVSSFGLTGTNVHVILQEPPKAENILLSNCIDRTNHILCLSAQSEDALRDLIDRYIAAIEEDPKINLPDFAYSANVFRAHLRHRTVITASDTSMLLSRLRKGYNISGKVTGTLNNKIAFLFTGQGSQYLGMANELYDTQPYFRAVLDRCDSLLRSKYGLDLKSVLSYEGHSQTTNVETCLDDSIFGQPALFCIGYSLAMLWKSFGVHPDFVLGHSVGEFAAAVVAGVLSLEDGIDLVVQRSMLVSRLPKGKMLVVKASQEVVGRKILEFDRMSDSMDSKYWVDIAAVNSDNETVVTGTIESIDSFEIFCKSCNSGIITQKLNSSHAFHSRAMNTILNDYRNILSFVDVASPKNMSCRFISGAAAMEMEPSMFDSSYWISHLRQTVKFKDSFEILKKEGCNIFVEIGPQPVLLGLAMGSVPLEMTNLCTWCPSIRRNENDWVTILASLGRLYISGVDIDWVRFDSCYQRSRLTLPNYPFQREKFWHKEGQKFKSSVTINSKLLHPIIGRRIPCPQSEYIIYHNSFNINSLPYIRDHKVVDRIILPAAGYLEAVLAAGRDVLCGGTSAQVTPAVRDLEIESALPFVDEDSIQLETVLCPKTVEQGRVEYDVSIYKQLVFDPSGSDGGKWKKLISATFVPCVFMEASQVLLIDLPNLKSTMTKRDPADLEKIYNKIKDMGISFGPSFRSVQGIWSSETQFLIETTLPSGSNIYVSHPILLDCMVQSCAVTLAIDETTPTEGLYIPKQLKSCVCLPNPYTEKIYVVVNRKNPASSIGISDAKMYNSEGVELASMDGLSLVQTTREGFVRSICSDAEEYPEFFELVWRPSLGSNAKRLAENENIFNKPSTTSRIRLEFDKHPISLRINEVIHFYSDKTPYLEHLSYLYILKAFVQLGISNIKDGGLSISDFRKSSSVLPQHGQLLNRFFQILAEEGDVQFCGGDSDRIKILRSISSLEDIEANILGNVARFRGHDYIIEVDYIINCGENLAAELQGKMSPYSILFPESQSIVGAAALYNSIPLKLTNEVGGIIVQLIIEEVQRVLKENEQKDDFVVRILEIGGGIGAATVPIIAAFEACNLTYEYTFTDISPLFLKEASKRFPNNKNIKFKLLDIEKDPNSQGFAPYYFEFIIADLVLHATNDLNETLNNVRYLQAPSSYLLIMEFLRPIRYCDISFGFLEGWWRFNDFRKDHSALSGVQWKELLVSHGYMIELSPTIETSGTINTEGGERNSYFGVIAASYKMPTNSISKSLVQTSMSSNDLLTWVICGHLNDGLTNQLTEQFKDLGKPIIHLYCTSTTFQTLSSSSFNLDPLELSHFTELVQNLRNRNIVLEGIVYLWGMQNTQGGANSSRSNGGGNFYNNDFNITCSTLTKLFSGLLNISKALLSVRYDTNIYVVTNQGQIGPVTTTTTTTTTTTQSNPPRNPISSILWGIMMSLNNEFANKQYISIDVDLEVGGGEGEDLRNNRLIEVSKDIFSQIWLNEPEYQILYRNKNKYVRRLIHAEPYRPSLPLPNSDCYKLVNPSSGLFSDFNISSTTRIEVGPNDVEINVKAVGLNFKDVLIAMNTGVNSSNLGGSNPTPIPNGSNELGMDFSGSIVNVGSNVVELKIGDRVCGLVPGGALTSHLVVKASHVFLIPSHLSYEAACTICTGVCTSKYFLSTIAKISSKDKVLIHVGSGGVGLASIRLAQSIGCDIYATAGSNRKRNYLKNFCNLKHVYSSRTLDFGSQILVDTNGYGVDVVLNALTGPHFKETSLSICAPNARFLEMSKINVWTVEQVKVLRPDVYYYIMDISDEEAQDEGLEILLNEFSNVANFHPLPFTLFTLSRAPDAFKYLQEAKHIGKVVIKMPSTQFKDGQISHTEELFNEYSSYLITGGLGGIGLEVAKWMISVGAKYLVLVGRNPPSPSIEGTISNLRAKHQNVHILVWQGDVSDYATCETLLNSIKAPSLGFPPLKGIMHAAGVLHDDHLLNQNIESFLKIYKPKILGAWNLHTLTINYDLDYFILFSSIISIVGGLGQSNHCSANKYLDEFAKWRHELGLPAISINWGAWSDVGAAASIKHTENLFGIRKMSPSQGIASLARVMLDHKVNVTISDISDWGILTTNFNQGALFEYINMSRSSKVSSEELEARIQVIKNAPLDELFDKVKEFLEYIIRDTLRLSDNEPLDPNQDLRELGIDSLMVMELRTRIQPLLADYDTRVLSAHTFIEARTINKFTKLITLTISRGATCKYLNAEEQMELVRQDIILPDDIILNSNTEVLLAPPSKMKSILLTGANGHLGVYILNALLQHSNHVTIYCLIRADSDASATERLENALEELDLLESTFNIPENKDRIICYHGNITQDYMGLDQSIYDELSIKIDGVIHTAIMSNHMLPYGNFGFDDIRSNNVLGLLNVLRFATKGKTKYFHYPSSVACLTKLNEDGSFPENLPSLDDFGQVHKTGYSLSKFICEKLLKIALEERKLPINIIRHHYLTCDSKTGLSPMSRNHVLMFLIVSEMLGMIPNLEGDFTVVPVDVAAGITVELFMNDSVPPGVYNLNNPKTSNLVELRQAFERKGIQLKSVSTEEWLEAAAKADLGENLVFLSNYMKEVMSSEVWSTNPLIELGTSKGISFANSMKLKQFVPNVDERMSNPIELFELQMQTYESMFGKDKVRGLIEALNVRKLNKI